MEKILDNVYLRRPLVIFLFCLGSLLLPFYAGYFGIAVAADYIQGKFKDNIEYIKRYW